VSAASLDLAIVLGLIDQSVEAYRVLLREYPLDWGEEATQRQQEAADLLDRAQTLGGSLGHEERSVFTESFSSAVGMIERLETLRATNGYDPEADEDIDAGGGPSLVIGLVGGPLNGQTRNLDSSSSDEGAIGTAPRSIQFPHITEREVCMITYLRDSESNRGEWTYFYVGPSGVAGSLEGRVSR